MELIEIISLISISAFLLGFLLNKLFRKKVDFEISLFQSYLSGLIFIYLLVLLSVPLNFLIHGIFYFSITTLLFFIFYFYSIKKIKFVLPRFAHILVFSIIAIYLSKDVLYTIVYEPILEWDARSIWYFKAKQLFFANGFNDRTGIDGLFSMQNSHAEYPILVPVLGAFVAKYIGYWNEYLPKSNLIFLWLGILFAFYSFKNMHILSKIVIFFSLIIISPYSLTNGYMDVWLGIYSALSILFLIEYVNTFKTDYLLNGLICLVFCNYIKHDAALITISLLSSFIFLTLITKNWRLLKCILNRIRKMVPILFFLMLPFLIWIFYKNKWGTKTDFEFKKLLQITTFDNTFTFDKINQISKSLMAPIGFIEIIIVLSTLSIVAIAYSKFCKFPKPFIKNGIVKCFFPILSAILFAIGMHILYCLSAVDLTWHLATSADRLRLDLLFISLPSLYGIGGMLFYKN